MTRAKLLLKTTCIAKMAMWVWTSTLFCQHFPCSFTSVSTPFAPVSRIFFVVAVDTVIVVVVIFAFSLFVV